jgi:hypothetical protein
MKMRRFFTLVAVALAVPAQVRAGDALQETLAAIPGDAMAFIAVPNFKQLDTDYQKAIASLSLQQFVPPPMNSLISALKQRAPMLEKIDDDGSIIVVFMPATSLPELQTKQAIILSAKDPKALMEAMNGQPGEGGMWTVNLFGMPMYAIPSENRVIVSMMPDVAKSVKESKANIASQLNKQVLTAFDGLDLIIWIEGQKLVAAVRPLVEGMVLPMMTAQSGASGFEAKYNEYQVKNIKLAMDGLGSLTIGLALGDAGLTIRTASTTVPNSELAKRTRLKTTSESLLNGLPAGDYALSYGQIMDPAAMKQASGDLEFLFGAGADIEGVDKDKLKKLQNSVMDMVASLSGARGAFEFITPGPDGLFGATLILETGDAEKWLASLGDVSETGKEVALSAAKAHATKEGEDEKEVDEFFSAVTYAKDAETVAGIKTSHFKVDLEKIAKMNEADEEEIEEAQKIVGKDGLLFRVAAADAKNVVISFGGGEPRMSKFIAAAKENGAPLSKSAGVENVSKHLPKERNAVVYVAVDHIIAGVKRIQQYMEEEVLPIQMPALNAPAALAVTGGEGWAQYDIFLPTELLVAGKNAAMSMMGAGEQPADQPEEKQ